MSTVCVLYGVAEGPRIGRRLCRALEAKGFRLVSDPKEADVIIAHSGGSLLLPSKVQARQIIQIAPYWRGRSWIAATVRKHVDEWRAHRKLGELPFWYYKAFWNSAYFLNMSTLMRMVRGLKNGWHLRHGKITTIVRPRFDPYCSADHMPHFKEDPTFISFPGYHDDIWLNPAPYLALLKKDS